MQTTPVAGMLAIVRYPIDDLRNASIAEPVMIAGWHNVAFNQAQDSANEIHGDRVARQYGFRGGLVPGVTISACLVHPAVVTWGRDFLERGYAHVRVGAPLYDAEPFRVDITAQDDARYTAEITQDDGRVSATAEVSLPARVPPAPARRGDPVAERDYQPPPATLALFEQLRQHGCRACRYHWRTPHNMQTYVRDADAMPALLRPDGEGFANSAWLLGTSNWVLASNAHMNPWVHLETRSQHYRAIPPDTTVVAEMAVRDAWPNKGHEFVDVEVNLFDEADDAPLASIELRAIYRLRGL